MSNDASRFIITKTNDDDEDSEIHQNEVSLNLNDPPEKDLLLENNALPLHDISGCLPTISNMSRNSDALALYAEDLHLRGRFQSFIQTVSSYTAAIPVPSNSNCEEDSKNKKKKNAKVAKLGTLVGVFLPCIQNIFGVILFIRLSWIVGTAGIVQGFLIVFICCSCTMLTAVSMSAIATNGVVPAGGSYFMISRSLGPEFGGAVGVLFYLGTSFASSMYILGAVEILLTFIAPQISLFGDISSTNGVVSTAMLNNMRVYGTFFVLLLGALVFIGVKYVNKCASLFLACVLLSILSIFIGFFTIHARSSPSVCYVGHHLIAASSFSSCSKNDSTLLNVYKNNYDSYLFYNNSIVREEKAIPGITSGLFIDNCGSHYRKAGEIMKGIAGSSGEIVADMTTSFTILIAIFFPSVTGIMAGSNRSGNLKNAQYSIPRGTIAAILTTSIIYLTSVLFLGATANGDVLRDKYGESIGGLLLVSKLAWPNKWFILIGSLLSTIGAGLQSLTGAPRLLQAIANDGVIPFLRVFSTVSKDGEPTRALLVTLLISEIGVLVASLDAVAPIITMFFLMCYGFVNFACTLQSLLRLPNWRPRFRYYHWSLSLLGVCLCLALMFISSWYYALVAVIVAGFVYKYIEYRGAEKEWGDGLSGLSLSAARYGLLRLADSQMHTKNWRPQLLVLCETGNEPSALSETSKKLIAISGQLKAGRGLTIVGAVLKGSYLDSSMFIDELDEDIQEEMKKSKVKGFHTVLASSTLTSGLSSMIQCAGLGGLKPNTVFLSWPQSWRDDPNWHSFLHCVRVTSEMKRALVVAKNADLFPDFLTIQDGYMDIWWIVHDGGLMLLMIFLLRQHKVWKHCKLRLFTVAQITDNSIQIRKDLLELMYNLRMTAEIEVIELHDSDISAYTYERTLKAEQRKQMVSMMKLSRKESKKEAQLIIDKRHFSRSHSLRLDSNADEEPCELLQSTNGPECDKQVISPTSSQLDLQTQQQDGVNDKKPDESNVRRMDTAVKINKLVCEKSQHSRLVLINLPKPPMSSEKGVIYMEFIEALTENVERVFLVRGGGHEVVTIYS